MTKMFAMLVGWVLIVVGVLNFFHTPGFNVFLQPAHGIFHIVAGILGVWAARSHSQGYAMWVGVVGIVLAVVGFFGLTSLFDMIDLPVWINVIHAVLGVWGILTLWAAMKKPAAPAAGQPMGGGAM